MELFRKISDNPSIVWINGEVVAERIDADYYHANHIQLNKSKIPMFKISTYCYLSKKRFNPNKYNKEYFKYIDISNVDNNTGVFEYQLVNINEAPSRARKKVSKNDIIISTVRPNRNAVAIVNIEDDELVVSTGFAVIECKKNIDSYYLFAVLKTSNSIGQLVRKTSGGLYPAVSEQDVMEIEIPIPSPEIQKYIGDKVRKAEELREKAKKLKKEAEEIIYKKLGNIVLEDEKNYTANYIREEDIFERIDSEYYKEKYFRLQKQLKSKGFSLKTLDELCDSNIFNGRTYKTTNKKRKYMNIGVGELGDWFILANGDKYIDENINTNYLLDRYSIIWGNSAHLAKYIGEKVNINLETNSYVPTTEITCIKPNLDKINPYYLFLYMKSNWGYYQVQRTVKGMTAHSYPEDVSKIIVPILDFSFEELNVMKSAVELGYRYTKESKQLVQEAKQDVEDLIEGNFDMSKVRANS